jgi:prepilin-type N-terminal cleavage/methylation domain-containing protein
MKNIRGFSLIEIMLVIAIIVILSAITLPIQSTLLSNNYLSETTSNIQASLRTASLQAKLGSLGMPAGVWVGKDGAGKSKVISYRGKSYQDRNTEFDIVVDVVGGVVVSATPEPDINFSILNGTITRDTFVTIKSPSGERVLHINLLGTVIEEKPKK